MSRLAERAKRRLAAANIGRSIKVSEDRYARGLLAVLRAVHKEYMAYFEPRLKERAHADSLTDFSGELDMLGIHVQAQVVKHVAPLFDKMSGTVNKANRIAQSKLLGITPSDTRVAVQIAAAREANIRLVENAARVYAQSVREIFESPNSFGLGVDDLRQQLLERGDVSESRAELIARDQTLKLNGDITQARQENAGVTSYVWSTSHDERVRDTHAELDGQEFDWASPPEPGHPGDDYQCRCVALPVIAELEGI